jgi:hypothetical protein
MQSCIEAAIEHEFDIVVKDDAIPYSLAKQQLSVL